MHSGRRGKWVSCPEDTIDKQYKQWCVRTNHLCLILYCSERNNALSDIKGLATKLKNPYSSYKWKTLGYRYSHSKSYIKVVLNVILDIFCNHMKQDSKDTMDFRVRKFVYWRIDSYILLKHVFSYYPFSLLYS